MRENLSVSEVCRARSDAAPPLNYEREQLQPLPHRQIAPQRHPGRRVPVFFFDI